MASLSPSSSSEAARRLRRGVESRLEGTEAPGACYVLWGGSRGMSLLLPLSLLFSLLLPLLLLLSAP